MTAIDLDEARRMLDVLDCNDNTRFRTFPDNKSRKVPAMCYASSDFLHLPAENQKGAGVFFVVNETTGDKDENVTAVRSFFTDLDGAPLDPITDCGMKPHIIIESSPGRYHAYWKVAECPLDRFKPIQQAIAARFNGDKSVVNLSRVMRLPGFIHQKADPFQTRIISVDDRKPYTVQQIVEGLELSSIFQGEPKPQQTAAKPLIQEGKRNDSLAKEIGGFLKHNPGSSLQATTTHALTWNTKNCADPLNDSEVRRTAKSIYDADRRNQPVIIPKTDQPIKQPRIVFQDIHEFYPAAEPVYFIQDLIEAQSVVSVLGESGSGKSFLVQSWAFSCVTGLPWSGKEIMQGVVLYFCGEGLNGVPRRFAALTADTGIQIPENRLFIMRTRIGIDADSIQEISTAVDELSRQHGAPVLIVVDTLARFFVGNENSTQDMTTFVNGCDSLKERYGSVVMIVHHTGLGADDRGRGSTSFKAAMDAEVLVNKKNRRIEFQKMKDAEPPPPMGYEIESIGDSAVFRVTESTTETSTFKKRSLHDELALKTFETLAIANKAGVRVCLKEWKKAFISGHTADSLSVKERSFRRCRERLIKDGTLSVLNDEYSPLESGLYMGIMFLKKQNQRSGAVTCGQ
jgi:hypothetical protein